MDRLISKFKENGFSVDCVNGYTLFEPKHKSTLQYLMIAAMIIPAIFLVLFITGISLRGVIVLGAGISCLYHGLKSKKEVDTFNNLGIKISDKEVMLSNDMIIPLAKVVKFKAGLSTNPLFPNVIINLVTQDDTFQALAISQKNVKYLNQDKFTIVEKLNSLIEEKKQIHT